VARLFIAVNFPILEPQASALARVYAESEQAPGPELLETFELAGLGYGLDIYSQWLGEPTEEDDGDPTMVHLVLTALKAIDLQQG